MSTITRITPEGFDVANAYLQYGDVATTAEQLDIPQHEVVRLISVPEVRRYIDGVLLDMGYRNRNKLGRLLDEMIDSKIEEARESGVYTSKDLLELIQMAHKMRMDEIKASKEAGPGIAVQVNQIGGGGENYNALMGKLGFGSK